MSAISGVSGSSNAWAAVSSQRSQQQAKMFAKADSDSSGGVNTAELSSMLSEISQKTGVSMGDSSELFAQMDSDGDGSLTSAELGDGMKGNGPPPPSTMAFAQSRGAGDPGDNLFAEMDANSDGSLNADEMTALMARIESDTGENVEEKIGSLDSDGDGSLSQTEFAAGKPSGPPPGGPPPGGGPGGAGGASASSESSTTYEALDTNEDGTVSILERLAGEVDGAGSDSDESASADSSSGESAFQSEIAKFAQALYQQIGNSADLTSAFTATA